MIITLKDGSKKEYSSPMSIIDIAKDLSEGLARVACVGEVDGEVKDLRTVIDKDRSENRGESKRNCERSMCRMPGRNGNTQPPCLKMKTD